MNSYNELNRTTALTACASTGREAFGVRRIPALSFRAYETPLGHAKAQRRDAGAEPHKEPTPWCLHSIRFARFSCAFAALCILWFMLLTLPCRADDIGEKGRALFKKNQHSVVTVQIVLKSKFSVGGRGGQSNESRQDVTGTVVDPSGLAVLSLSAVDPGQLLQNMMSGASEDESRFKMETELSDVKILLEDGTEVPAEVVLRDKDLDLAFIRPKLKPAAPMAALDLAKSGKAEILDQVITLNRLGNAAGRAYAASVERISAIVQRPRLFYVPDASMTTTALGSPAFTLDGKPLGIFVMRSLKGKSGGGMGMFGAQPENLTGIILPADDVVKAAKQAPAVVEEKQKEKEKK